MSTIKELTGGTGDVNPQMLTGAITQPANDVTAGFQFTLPVPRLTAKPNRVIVVEILKVVFIPSLFDWVFQNNARLFLTASTSGSNFLAGDPQTFAVAAYYYNQPLLATELGIIRREATIDVTDGAGHGILVATTTVTVGISSFSTGATNQSIVKLIYRYKEIPLTEMLGIVTGQT